MREGTPEGGGGPGRAAERDAPLLPLRVVDAFTDRPFGGNPAAVCLVPEPLSPETMQRVAAEMNLSETAFVEPPDPEGMRRLRWFTPTTEVSLCGHATLATAHVLLTRGEGEPADGGPLRFRSLSGPLTVAREGDGRLRMDFPADPPEPAPPPPGLLEALGAPPDTETLRGRRAWLVRRSTAEEVAATAPDIAALAEVPVGDGILGVTVTAPGGGPGGPDGVPGRPDFLSRFFAPWVGVPEDPVTGMAHCVLGSYWSGVLGRSELVGRQISERGGEVGVRVEGDRIHLLGRAVTVLEGRIRTG